MKVEAADLKVSGELLFPPADGIIGIVIRFGIETTAFDDPARARTTSGDLRTDEVEKDRAR